MTDLIGIEVEQYKQRDKFKEDMKATVTKYKASEEFQ